MTIHNSFFTAVTPVSPYVVFWTFATAHAIFMTMFTLAIIVIL